MSVLRRMAPPMTGRRLLATMARDVLTDRVRLRHRLAPDNLRLWIHHARTSFTCCVCGATGRPYFDLPDSDLRARHGIGVLRETLFCRSCGASMRQRTLAKALLSVLPTTARRLDQITAAQLDGVRVLDTDDHSPIAAILKKFPGYKRSTFEPGVANGEIVSGGAVCADLEDLPFDDSEFDVILTSDVMEHVRDDDAAHAEIYRCLRPGGAYVFTLPYDPRMASTRVLVDTTGKRDVYLEVPHFHGDPIRGGILAYRIYGRDLLQTMRNVGFEVEDHCLTDPEFGIFEGDVLVAHKPSAAANRTSTRVGGTGMIGGSDAGPPTVSKTSRPLSAPSSTARTGAVTRSPDPGRPVVSNDAPSDPLAQQRDPSSNDPGKPIGRAFG